MKPIRTARSNFTFKGPTPDVGDLPCRLEPTVAYALECYSTWELSHEERIAIAEGANIELRILGVPIPPVSLAIDSTPVLLDEPE